LDLWNAGLSPYSFLDTGIARSPGSILGKQLAKAPRHTGLCAIQSQHCVKSVSVPSGEKVRQHLTLRERRKNIFHDPLMLPADQNDPGELLHLCNKRGFITDTMAGVRGNAGIP
jgi:hypothetical protein